MSDGYKEIWEYADLSGPEYSYLGHFRQHEYLCEGHNDLELADQIEAGNIPNIRPGTNTPADAEPGSISGTNATGEAAGKAQDESNAGKAASSTSQTSGGSMAKSVGMDLLKASFGA